MNPKRMPKEEPYWIFREPIEKDGYDESECSVCGRRLWIGVHDLKYCPWCGVRMTGKAVMDYGN